MLADVVGRFLRTEPKTFVDVGIGLGEEASDFLSRWPRLEVVGLEPNPAMVPAGYPGRILPYGAWSEPKTVWTKDRGRQTSVFVPGTFEVRLERLDDLLPHVRGVVLWLDVEGAELEALRGARSMLKRTLAVNAETRVERKHPRSCCMSEVDAFLAAHGFCKAVTYNYCGGEDPHEDAVYVRCA